MDPHFPAYVAILVPLFVMLVGFVVMSLETIHAALAWCSSFLRRRFPPVDAGKAPALKSDAVGVDPVGVIGDWKPAPRSAWVEGSWLLESDHPLAWAAVYPAGRDQRSGRQRWHWYVSASAEIGAHGDDLGRCMQDAREALVKFRARIGR
jgi:hypothetical protein